MQVSGKAPRLVVTDEVDQERDLTAADRARNLARNLEAQQRAFLHLISTGFGRPH
jgi:tRNA nucleotidyltransferase (CCA-adding enzyme)